MLTHFSRLILGIFTLCLIFSFSSHTHAGEWWTKVDGSLTHVSVGSERHVWGVNAVGEVFQFDGSAWKLIPGGLSQISVGSDGDVWGVNSYEQVFRYDGDSWVLINGSLTNVSVGSKDHVWGVNAVGEVWRYNGTTWDLIPGGLSQVSVGSDGSVWGVNNQEQIFRYDGTTWIQVKGSLVNVSVGSRFHAWGVNAAGEIWRFEGNSWKLIPGGLSQISVGFDGSVWGVNEKEIIWTGAENIRKIAHRYPPHSLYAVNKGFWHEYAKYVQSHTTVKLDHDGEWIIETKFSNGHRTLPQSMGLRVLATSDDGECLFYAYHEIKLDPSYGGSAREKIQTTRGRIWPEEVGLLGDVEFYGSQLTSDGIKRFNTIKPYGQTIPSGAPRACP